MGAVTEISGGAGKQKNSITTKWAVLFLSVCNAKGRIYTNYALNGHCLKTIKTAKRLTKTTEIYIMYISQEQDI